MQEILKSEPLLLHTKYHASECYAEDTFYEKQKDLSTLTHFQWVQLTLLILHFTIMGLSRDDTLRK